MLSAPVLRRKPQSKGNIGDGKRYADWAAFKADQEAWKQEQSEHSERMAERKRTRDKQRDRSDRKRGTDQETDSERVVRQRQENAAAANSHAQQQATQRLKPRLAQQQAWARDVGVFADVFSSAEPQSHPLAYSYHLRDSWLKDGVLICTLRDYIAGHPPHGGAAWEVDVDNKAFQLWGQQEIVRGGYLMLIQLPSAPQLMVATLREERVDPGSHSVNSRRAARGLGPTPGWDALVAAGYMQPPPHQELPANEIELIDRGGARADEVWHELRSTQEFCDPCVWHFASMKHMRCHRWHNSSVPCDQAHRFPFHRNVMRYLPHMGGEVYVEGRSEPVQGHIPVDRYIELISTKDKWGRPVDHRPEFCLASSDTVSAAARRAGDAYGSPLCKAAASLY